MKSLRAAVALTVALSPIAHARTIARAPQLPAAPKLLRPSMPGSANWTAPVAVPGAVFAPALSPVLSAPANAPAAALASLPPALLAPAPAMTPDSPLSALSAAHDAPAPQDAPSPEAGRAQAASTFDGSALGAPSDSPVAAGAPAPSAAPRLDLPSKTFKLANGLTVVVHTDKTAPVVAVSITYKVGSMHETPGLGGFAHLFEHLMAQGTKSLLPREISRLIESNGGVRNAYTMRSNTTYHSVVPKSALKTVLWAEAERMSTLNVDDRALALEQQVVLEEMRLRYVNQAYAKARDAGMAETAFTKWENRHTTIGEPHEIRNARLEDVRAFYRKHYAPNNAVIALAGDVDEAEARELVERFYGPLAPGEIAPAPDLSEPPIAEGAHRVIDDKFAKVPLLMTGWRAPERGTKAYWALTVLAELLGGGDESPLYRALVKEEKLAAGVSTNFPWWTGPFNPGGPDLFGFLMPLKPGVASETALALVDRVLSQFVWGDGATSTEVEAAKARLELSWTKDLEQLIDRAKTLSSYAAMVGDVSGFSRDFAALMAVTPQDIRAAVNEWLVSKPRAIVEARPAPQLELAADPATPPVPEQRPRPAGDPKPELDAQRAMPVPAMTRFTLSNGMKVVIVNDDRLPVVEARLSLPAGRTTEAVGEDGLSLAASDLLLSGTPGRDAAAVSAAFSKLGWKLDTERGLEHLTLKAAGLSRNAAAFFRELASVLTDASYPADEVSLWKENKAEDLKTQRAKPDFMSSERLKAEVFGAHPYGKPALSDEQLAAVTRERVTAYARRAYSPRSATLVLTGDVDPAAARTELEAAFAGWNGPAAVAAVPVLPAQGDSRLALVDRPGSKQANLTIASAIDLRPGDPDWLAFTVMNHILGGSATSRLFVNLRVDKGYTYGSYSRPQALSRGTLWTATAETRNEVAAPALEEMRKEIRRMREEPVSAEQLAAVKRYLAGLFVLKNSSIDYTADSLASYERNGQDPASELATYLARLEALTPEDIQRVARLYLDPEKMVTVVVGDAPALRRGLSP